MNVKRWASVLSAILVGFLVFSGLARAGSTLPPEGGTTYSDLATQSLDTLFADAVATATVGEAYTAVRDELLKREGAVEFLREKAGIADGGTTGTGIQGTGTRQTAGAIQSPNSLALPGTATPIQSSNSAGSQPRATVPQTGSGGSSGGDLHERVLARAMLAWREQGELCQLRTRFLLEKLMSAGAKAPNPLPYPIWDAWVDAFSVGLAVRDRNPRPGAELQRVTPDDVPFLLELALKGPTGDVSEEMALAAATPLAAGWGMGDTGAAPSAERSDVAGAGAAHTTEKSDVAAAGAARMTEGWDRGNTGGARTTEGSDMAGAGEARAADGPDSTEGYILWARASAAVFAGKCPDHDALAVLTEILRRAPELQMRAYAAWGLARQDPAQVFGPLLDAMSDPALRVRENARSALYHITDQNYQPVSTRSGWDHGPAAAKYRAWWEQNKAKFDKKPE